MAVQGGTLFSWVAVQGSTLFSWVVASFFFCVAVQGGNSSSSMTIRQLQWGPVRIVNTTLTCVAVASTASMTQVTAPPGVRLVAETPQQLQHGLELLGQLQPFTITLARDMTIPVDTWPRGLLVEVPMLLAGLPPPAPRTLLDLYQVRLYVCGGGVACWPTGCTCVCCVCVVCMCVCVCVRTCACGLLAACV